MKAYKQGRMARRFKFLTIILAFCMTASALAADTIDVFNTAEYILNTVTEPTISSVGGEWAVIALSQSGFPVDNSYYEKYYANVEKILKENNGSLSATKYTEYSRLIIALSAIGKDVTNTAGYNLLEKISDLNNVVKQGVNGAIFALIALDCKGYEPVEGATATREALLSYILDREISGGGYALGGEMPSADITGMALVALAKYSSDEGVSNSITRCLSLLSEIQNESGGFSSDDVENTESIAQIIIGTTALGIDPVADYKFQKQGNTLLTALSKLKNSDGSFKHDVGSDTDLMSTEQALCALVAYEKMSQGGSALYDFSKTIKENGYTESEVNPFTDIEGHWAKEMIIGLYHENILSGVTQSTFEPGRMMSRAEFSAVISRTLSLESSESTAFYDVTDKDWFYPYVNAVAGHGYMLGSDGFFNPQSNITREEAAVVIERVAKALGYDAEIHDGEVLSHLSHFIDYSECADWSVKAIASSVKLGLLSGSDLRIRPKDQITRAEVCAIISRLNAI